MLRFLTQLNSPIAARELRGSLRRWWFLVVFTIALALCATGVLVAGYMIWASNSGGITGADVGKGLAGTIVWVLAGLIFLLTPGVCSMLIASERAQKTFDMLTMTRLKPWQIIWGKFLTAVVYLVMFLLATMPLACFSFLYGGVNPGDILLAYDGLFAFGALLAMIAISVSAAFRSVVWSVIVSYLTIIFTLFAGFCLCAWFYLRHVWGLFGPDNIVPFSLLSIVLATACVFIFAGFYLSAVSRVSPAASNRSAPLRVYSTCTIPAFLMLLAVWYLYEHAGLATTDFWRDAPWSCLLGTGALLTVLFVMMFPLEKNTRSRRTKSRRGLRTSLARLFSQGGRSGAAFCVLSAAFWCVVALIAALAFVPSGWHDADVQVGLLAVLVFLFVTAHSMIALRLSLTRVRAWGTRLIMVGILLANMVVPLLITAVMGLTGGGGNTQYYFVYYLSPLGSCDILGHDFLRDRIVISYAFYLTLALLFFLLSRRAYRRWRRENVPLSYPMVG